MNTLFKQIILSLVQPTVIAWVHGRAFKLSAANSAAITKKYADQEAKAGLPPGFFALLVQAELDQLAAQAETQITSVLSKI